jgi:uncharacterized membrane protein YphA (DoxX/SURF4 family)
MYIVCLSSILINLLFLLSGFNKIQNFSSVCKGFISKTNASLFFAQIIIALVIILEIIAPLIISFYFCNFKAHSKNNFLKTTTKISIVALILFTILATYLYHFPPTGKSYYSFMSNLSTIGGLLLLFGFLTY